MTTPDIIHIEFTPASKHVFVRPGQLVTITIGGVHVHVEGVDYDPCRDTSTSPHKAEHMVILKPGEMYSTKRDDGTLLRVRAE